MLCNSWNYPTNTFASAHNPQQMVSSATPSHQAQANNLRYPMKTGQHLVRLGRRESHTQPHKIQLSSTPGKAGMWHPSYMWFALMHQRRPPVYFPLSLTTRSTQDSRLTTLRSRTSHTSIECQLPSHRIRYIFPFILYHSRYSGQSVEWNYCHTPAIQVSSADCLHTAGVDCCTVHIARVNSCGGTHVHARTWFVATRKCDDVV